MEKIIFKSKINWGTVIYLVTLFILILNIFSIFYLLKLLVNSLKNKAVLILLFSFLPIVLLDFIFYPVFESVLYVLLKKDKFEILINKEGIKIKNNFLSWNKVKSISFSTGRSDKNLFSGNLLALQRIYILDKKGKEYSCIIDVDYLSKNNRNKNNLNMLRESLIDIGFIALISDWAEP